MSQPWTGVNAQFALSLAEASFGTDTARAISYRPKSVTLASKTTTTIVDDLAAYVNGPTERVLVDQEVVGDVVMNAAYRYNGLGLLLKAALGSVAESGAGPYTHTFTSGTLSSFTGEVLRGSSAVSEVMVGLYLSKLVFEIPARGPVTLTASWVGKSSAARGTPSPAAPALATSAVYILGHQCTGITFNSVLYSTEKITITIDNKLEGLKEHGSIYIGDAQRTTRQEITVDVEMNQRANTGKGAALAGTSAAWSVAITDATNSLTFSGGAGFLETHEDGISSSTSIKEKWKLRSMAVQGSSAAISVALINADNTYEDT